MPGISQGIGRAIAEAFFNALGAGAGNDQEAIDEAVSTMVNMTGNSGQESIVSIGEPPFREWANWFLEDPDSNPDPYENLSAYLSEDALAGTQEIWAEGTRIVQEQSMWHDSEDETGEGTGVEVESGGLLSVLKSIF